MAMYRTCPYCNASLDPGERCDCQKEKASSERMTPSEQRNNQVIGVVDWAVKQSALAQ